MKLNRVVTVTLDEPEKQFAFSLGRNAVQVEVKSYIVDQQKPSGLLLIASTEVAEDVALDADSYVIVPEIQRRACEDAIMFAADLLSVFARTRRQVASAFPCVAFSDLSTIQLDRLNASKGIRPGNYFTAAPVAPLAIDETTLVASLDDRALGLSSLADLHSMVSALGRYRELIRFFEYAFRRSAMRLPKVLAKFLAGTGMNYDREEIDGWMKSRHGAMHGDRALTQRLVQDSDVRSLLPRMEQAAYDVLFNKKIWHDRSVDRRSVYVSPCATKDSRSTSLRLTQGKEANFLVKLYDDFDVFPRNYTVKLNPPGWWFQPPVAQQGPVPADDE